VICTNKGLSRSRLEPYDRDFMDTHREDLNFDSQRHTRTEDRVWAWNCSGGWTIMPLDPDREQGSELLVHLWLATLGLVLGPTFTEFISRVTSLRRLITFSRERVINSPSWSNQGRNRYNLRTTSQIGWQRWINGNGSGRLVSHIRNPDIEGSLSASIQMGYMANILHCH